MLNCCKLCEMTDQTKGDTNILRAARHGDLNAVLECLDSNTGVNTSNAKGLNALHFATKEGHVHVVIELLKSGASVNASTKKGNTSLHIACLAGHEAIVKMLAAYGADVNVQSTSGMTALYMAAQKGCVDIVKFLLDNGANPSLSTVGGFTPMAVALQEGREEVVVVLTELDEKGEKYQLSDAPPPYTYVDNSVQQTGQTGQVIILDKNEKSVFHNGARFNEFSKPHIPPPPPGCAPNALQQMQMEKGPLEVLMPQSHQNQAFDDQKT